MRTVTTMQLYKALRPKLGERETSFLIDFMEANTKNANEDNLKMFATKQDLKDEISLVRTDLKDEISLVRADLKDEIASVRLDLKNVEIMVERTEKKLTNDIHSINRWAVGILIALVGIFLSIYFKK